MNKVKPPVYTVTSFNELVNEVLTERVGPVLVTGEVSGVTLRRGRWLTFDLKDERSVVNCFAVQARIGIALEDGMTVKILGAPRIYVPYGKYSLNVQAVEPVGTGSLKRAYELLIQRLRTEGLFDPDHKQPLPQFPETIGIITSGEGAALHDVRRILSQRWGGVHIYLAPVPVQGVQAASAIVRAIRYFNTHHPVDTLIITRGGGSLEDLQAFNDELVAREIFSSRIPTIVGVGHETDESIAELVADVRAATPSHAAQLAVPDRETITLRVKQLEQRLRDTQHKKVTICGRVILHTIEIIQQYLDRTNQRVSRIEELLRLLDPRAVLAHGYSVTTLGDGTVLTNTQPVRTGAHIRSRLASGTIESEVTS